MTFPLLQKIYEIEGKKVKTNAQTLFYKVYCMTYITEEGNIGAELLVYNWWKFMFKAKYIMEAPKLSKAY